MREKIEVGYQTFVSDGGEEFKAVHSQKVIFECKKLDHRLRRAIGHAHDSEMPGL